MKLFLSITFLAFLQNLDDSNFWLRAMYRAEQNRKTPKLNLCKKASSPAEGANDNYEAERDIFYSNARSPLIKRGKSQTNKSDKRYFVDRGAAIAHWIRPNLPSCGQSLPGAAPITLSVAVLTT